MTSDDTSKEQGSKATGGSGSVRFTPIRIPLSLVTDEQGLGSVLQGAAREAGMLLQSALERNLEFILLQSTSESPLNLGSIELLMEPPVLELIDSTTLVCTVQLRLFAKNTGTESAGETAE